MPSVKPNTTEICYRWPNGKIEVKYRRVYGSKLAQKLINQVWKEQKQHGKECRYFVRHVYIRNTQNVAWFGGKNAN